jgi:hypothetical protein
MRKAWCSRSNRCFTPEKVARANDITCVIFSGLGHHMRLHTLCGPRGLGATSHGDCSFVVAALRSRDGIDVNLVQTTPLPESSLARLLL